MLAGAHVEFIKLQKHGLIIISYHELAECLARGSWILSEMVKASSELTAVKSQLKQKMKQKITDIIYVRNLAVKLTKTVWVPVKQYSQNYV